MAGLRRAPILAPKFRMIRRVGLTRDQIEAAAPLVRVVHKSPKAVLVSDGEHKTWVPLAALVASRSEPDIVGVKPWYRPEAEALPLFG